MNRRSFFKWLGIGVAAAVVAPSALTITEPVCVEAPKAYSTYVMGKDAIISGYFDYANFSDFAIKTSIDELVENTARELGEAHAYRITMLVKS